MAGYSETVGEARGTIDDQIYQSWVRCLTQTVGRSESFARQRASQELARDHARKLVGEFRSAGWPLSSGRFLDVGSGHGSLAVELALAGAQVTALEPCEAWRSLSEQRAAALRLNVQHIDGDAHELPFEDGAFDGCVSLQVLEHVRDPRRVVREIARVLKPGGVLFVTCENYLAFREPHYDVAWLPGMPKKLGSIYLRMRGRDPSFLREHVTYTYWPQLAHAFLDADLLDMSWEPNLPSRGAVERPGARKWRFLFKCIAPLVGRLRAETMIVCMSNRRALYRGAFTVFGRKSNGATTRWQ